jgi:hypothetical protein
VKRNRDLDALTIYLHEWQSITPDRDSPTRGVFLPQDPLAQSLAAKLSHEDVLIIQEFRAGLYLKATSFVGFITIGNLRIVIEPKLKGMQLMQL